MEKKKLPEKLYLIDNGYRSYETATGTRTHKFKNVFISETNDNNTPDYWIEFRVNKETESVDMQAAKIMANSLEMAKTGIDICAWITELSSTHGIEDEKVAFLCKKFLTLARPDIKKMYNAGYRAGMENLEG